jgi:hypothetical protein
VFVRLSERTPAVRPNHLLPRRRNLVPHASRGTRSDKHFIFSILPAAGLSLENSCAAHLHSGVSYECVKEWSTVFGCIIFLNFGGILFLNLFPSC